MRKSESIARGSESAAYDIPHTEDELKAALAALPIFTGAENEYGDWYD